MTVGLESSNWMEVNQGREDEDEDNELTKLYFFQCAAQSNGDIGEYYTARFICSTSFRIISYKY
jgi:hypothetical protein